MANFTFKMIEKNSGNRIPEKLTLTKSGVKGFMQSFTGKSGDYWVGIVPSINVSGYGTNEQEAINNLKDNVNLFWEGIFSLDEAMRKRELKNLGWTSGQFFKQQFSKVYVDEAGVLQNFDSPELVKINVLEAA